MTPSSKIIRDRALESKSFIRFYFHRANNKAPMIFTLPFLSNIQIDESQSASYSRLRPIGRIGSIPTYLGSDDRKLKLSFDLVLPHILSTGKNITQYAFQYRGTSLSTEEERARFFPNSALTNVAQQSINGAMKLKQSFLHARKHYEALVGVNNLTDSQLANLQRAKDLQGIDVVMWWVNLVRSAVRNNASNSQEPPPLIRLSHGIMYNDIPCICDEVRIEADQINGFDLKTMLPRVIKVRMDLTEIRLGDFTTYYPGKLVKGDNVAGWEAIIEHGTSDPYTNLL